MDEAAIYPSELVSLIKASIGEFTIIRNFRRISLRTGVWKIQSRPDGRNYFVKTYSRKHRWHPEVYAYRNWVGHLQPYVPELIAIYEGDNWQGILITSIEGTIMRDANLDQRALYDAYCKAGQLTRSIHDASAGEWFGRPDKDGNPIELFHHNDSVVYIHQSITDNFHSCAQLDLLESSEMKLVGILHRETGWLMLAVALQV